jgi:hypothetical protein
MLPRSPAAIISTLLAMVAVVLLATPASGDAICGDGSYSQADGQGACSHHGGVDYWLDGRGDPDTSSDDEYVDSYSSSGEAESSRTGSSSSSDLSWLEQNWLWLVIAAAGGWWLHKSYRE